MTAPKDAVRLTVRAKPRAKRSRVLRADGLVVEVAIAAPPVDGAANEELIATLAKALGVPKRAIVLAQGASSKNKAVDVSGLTAADVRDRVQAAASK